MTENSRKASVVNSYWTLAIETQKNTESWPEWKKDARLLFVYIRPVQVAKDEHPEEAGAVEVRGRDK